MWYNNSVSILFNSIIDEELNSEIEKVLQQMVFHCLIPQDCFNVVMNNNGTSLNVIGNNTRDSNDDDEPEIDYFIDFID